VNRFLQLMYYLWGKQQVVYLRYHKWYHYHRKNWQDRQCKQLRLNQLKLLQLLDHLRNEYILRNLNNILVNNL